MVLCLVSCENFFFFKQKTADEVRISDWSSDVCSSDLRGRGLRRHLLGRDRARSVPSARAGRHSNHATDARYGHRRGVRAQPDEPRGDRRGPPSRSEEHTSELQSLMRISYAVFCLKKKRTMLNAACPRIRTK